MLGHFIYLRDRPRQLPNEDDTDAAEAPSKKSKRKSKRAAEAPLAQVSFSHVAPGPFGARRVGAS